MKLPDPLSFAIRLALAALLALGAHALAGGAAFVGADRAVAVGVEPGEEGKRAAPGFLARHAAVAVRIGLTEHPAAEAGEHAALAAAATHAARFTALGAGLAALGSVAAGAGRIEFGATDLAIAVGVEVCETLRLALAALLASLTHLTALAPLAAAGLRYAARFVAGDEAIAIGVDAGEAGFNPCFHRSAGQGLGVAGTGGLGDGCGSAEHGKRRSGQNELFHELLLLRKRRISSS
jgi:hypothetical protein